MENHWLFFLIEEQTSKNILIDKDFLIANIEKT